MCFMMWWQQSYWLARIIEPCFRCATKLIFRNKITICSYIAMTAFAIQINDLSLMQCLRRTSVRFWIYQKRHHWTVLLYAGFLLFLWPFSDLLCSLLCIHSSISPEVFFAWFDYWRGLISPEEHRSGALIYLVDPLS